MKSCNCTIQDNIIPILLENEYPLCPPEINSIIIYLKETDGKLNLYGYDYNKHEFRLDKNNDLIIKVEGINKVIYNGDNTITLNITRNDLNVYSKQEIIELLENSGIIVLDSLNSDSTIAALSAKQGKVLDEKKVDKELGKELSSNDFTNEYKEKLDGIQSGAQTNQNLKTINNISLYATSTDTNINIAKGDYTSIVFKQSETQPNTPTGTNPIPSGWSTTISSSTGNWWMSSSLINGNTNQASVWSVPIKMVGSSGNSVTYVFKESSTRPATPTGTNPIPSGWSDAPTAIGKWWMSKATVSGQTGLVIGSWSIPVQTTAEDGIDGNYIDFKYAINNSTTVSPELINNVRNPPGWSDYPPSTSTTTYLWMTQATIVEDNLSGVWSTPVRISGENGKDGQWTSFVFKQSETQPNTPVGTSIIPSGWTDAPSGEGIWWMSKSLINYLGQAIEWTIPVRVTGNEGPQGVGIPGADGVTYYTWIRYADTDTGSGISNDPTGKEYIGFAYNKTTSTESNNPLDYRWSLIKGIDGQPGEPGTNTYTWIKYSDYSDGTGMYDIPTSSTQYIGIAVNKTTSAESTNKSDYTWSKFKGDNGQWTSFVFKNSETQPAAPIGTNPTPPLPGDWVDAPSGIGTWWMSQATVSGSSGLVIGGWKTPVKVTGSDARLVNLTATTLAVNYNTSGTSPNPTTITITASAVNTSGTAYYQFLLNDSAVQNTTSNTYTYIPKASYANMPDRIEVRLREGSTSSSILARDQITVIGMKAGSDSITVILSNEAHTFSADNAGIVSSYAGSGTTIQVFQGVNAILYDGVGIANNSFKVTPVGTNITAGALTDSGSYCTVANASAMNTSNSVASISFTIDGKTSEGITFSLVKVQNFSKSIAGSDGDYTVYQYAKNTSTSTSPSTGWTSTPPSLSTGEYLWMRFGTIVPPASSPSSWSTPVRISGENGQDGIYVLYQFAKNTSLSTAPSTGWNSSPPSLSSGEYLWMRFGTVTPPATTPTSWSTPVRISGENGQDGKDGPISYYMGAWSALQEYKGTDSVRNIVSTTSGSTTTYYITIATAGTFTGNAVTDTSKWATFEANYKSIATEFLFAESANIGGWIFHTDGSGNQMLQSQEPISGVPNTILNGTTGAITCKTGQIGGWNINATTIASQAGGTLLNGVTGEITATGSFSTNTSGFRAILSSSDRSLRMFNPNDVEVVRLSVNPTSSDTGELKIYNPPDPLITPNRELTARFNAFNTTFYNHEDGSSSELSGFRNDHHKPGLFIGYDGDYSSSNTVTNARFLALLFTNGKLGLFLNNLPTSSSGLLKGQVWNDGGTLKIIL